MKMSFLLMLLMAAAAAAVTAEGCPSGRYMPNTPGACVLCPVGKICAGGTRPPASCSETNPFITTRQRGKSSEADCVAAPGWELLPGADLSTARECPIGAFKAGYNRNLCSSCGSGLLTTKSALRNAKACYAPPGTGVVMQDGSLAAVQCLNGSYGIASPLFVFALKPENRSVPCVPCPANTVTRDQMPAAGGGNDLAPNAGPTSCLPDITDCEGAWGEWSSCTTNKANSRILRVGKAAAAVCAGTQTSTFNITKQASDGGAACPATDGQVRTRACNATEGCLVDCVGNWVAGPCEGVCGIGWMTYTYNVSVPARNGGKNCSTPDGATKDEECFLENACSPCTLTGVQANVIVGPSCGGNWRQGQTCTLSCPEDYTAVGSATLTCPRYSATVSASGFSCGPATPILDCTGAIQARDSNGTSLGYVSNNMLSGLVFTNTANLSSALNVSFSPASPPFDIRQHNSNPSRYNFWGLVQGPANSGTKTDLGQGSYNYLLLTTTEQTAPNATPAVVGNPYAGSLSLTSESAVWSFNASNNELRPQWVNSDGSEPTTTPFLHTTVNFFGVAGNITALRPLIGGSTAVSLHFVGLCA